MTQLDFESLKHTPEYETLQVLNNDGEVVNPDLMPDLSDDQYVDLYKQMLWSRVLGDRSTKLNRQGRLGFFAPTAGEEASQMGTSAAMDKGDFLLTAYRDIPQLIKHGLPMEKAFMWSIGHVNGNVYPDGLNAVPPQIIIGAQYVQTAGVALGLKKSGSKNVAWTYTGDGGTSQGDFYEGINFAGSFKAPALFVVQNNGYAISVPRHVQSAAPVLAQKAVAAGIPSVLVDGMDILAVYEVTKQAREWIAAGNGPVLIETICYRFGAHTLSGDDPKRYREKSEEEEWFAKDPLIRMKKFLENKGLWDDEKEAAYKDEVEAEIEKAMAVVESQPVQKVSEFLENTFDETPSAIERQVKEYQAKEGN